MKYFNLTFFFLFLFTNVKLFASPIDSVRVKACGTKPRPDEQMIQFKWARNNDILYRLMDSVQRVNTNLMLSNTSEVTPAIYRIGIRFWIYCSSGGDCKGMDDVFLQQRMDELNRIHKENNTGLQFYQSCEIRRWYGDDLLSVNDDEAEKMIDTDYHNGVLNVHFVDKLETSAGVYMDLFISDSEGIVVDRHSSLSTMVHEIGHNLDLEHTHRNSDGGECSQESVSRTRELPFFWCGCIESCKICSYRGDYLCDTPADPDLTNYVDQNCNFTGINLTDWWGDHYTKNTPNTRNIMSYATYRDCRNYFSPGQSGVMLYAAEGHGLTFTYNPKQFQFDRYEPDNTTKTARIIQLNTSQHHTFHWSKIHASDARDCDEDWLQFNITQITSGIVEISTDYGFYNNADTEIKLYHSSDLTNAIAYDDNSNQNNFSKLYVRDLPLGTYYIKITHKGNLPFNNVQDYIITLKECAPRYNCVNGVVKNGEIKKYYATEKLTAPCPGGSFVVENGGKAIFTSESKIILNSNFVVKTGGRFESHITSITNGSCDLASAQRQGKFQITTDTANYLPEHTIINAKQQINGKNRIISIYPNPIEVNSVIEYQLENDAIVNLSIYNIMGTEEVYSILKNNFETMGKHSVAINKGRLSNGVYICVLKTADKVFTHKITVLH